MAENYKLLYEQMAKLVDAYQNEIVPKLREECAKRVEVVHGRWVDIIDFGGGNCYGHCSKCSTPHKAENETALRVGYRYCRYCGAKMDGERKDNG